MKKTAVLAALALMTLPGVAAAMGCFYGTHDTASISCAEGTEYDSETQRCQPVSG